VNADESLTDIQRSLQFLLPELILTAGVIVLVLCSASKKISSLSVGIVAIASLLCATILSAAQYDLQERVFLDMLSIDRYGACLKLLISSAGIFACIISLKNERVRLNAAEFYCLTLSIVIGGSFLIMSTNLLMIFLSLEILSISSYLLASFAFDKKGSEGALKYFMFGSVASAVMLYGLSLLYGVTGTMSILDSNLVEGLIRSDYGIVVLMVSMILVGFLFKLGAVPLHFWAPDAYQGAPAHVVSLLSTVPKLAGLAALGRFMLVVSLFGQSQVDWRAIISILAVSAITIGNVGALMQQNAKRMMAWSSIAQAGFLMIGLGVLSEVSISYMIFYAAVYVAMNFVVFVFLEIYERNGLTEITQFSGVGKTNPFQIILLTVGLIALTGLPPTAGFTAKLLVFSSTYMAYEQRSTDPVLLTVLILGLLNTVVALFYYLKIPYYAFLKDARVADIPKWHRVVTKRQNFWSVENLLAVILVLVILVLFFIPGLLMGWIIKVNFAF
jgi:NADH-quinone oxidoreductase subunit N